MRTFSAVIARCADTGLLVGYVPGFPGAHRKYETLEELQVNLREVIAKLLEDGEPAIVPRYERTLHHGPGSQGS